MYNGIGLATVRGSATSGHVSKNLSYVRPEFFRKKVEQNSNPSRFQDNRNDLNLHRGADSEILEHNRKRAIEVKLFELREVMSEQGYTPEEIEDHIADMKTSTNTAVDNARSKHATDSHEMTARKEAENSRLMSAFGISGFVEGQSFDPEVQAEKKKLREVERQARDEERRKRQDEYLKREEERRQDNVKRATERRIRDETRKRSESEESDRRNSFGDSSERIRDRSRDRDRKRDRRDRNGDRDRSRERDGNRDRNRRDIGSSRNSTDRKQDRETDSSRERR